eukprot:11419508-Karenia_brevis.AAC.1
MAMEMPGLDDPPPNPLPTAIFLVLGLPALHPVSPRWQCPHHRHQPNDGARARAPPLPDEGLTQASHQ